jgi:transposase
MTMKNKSPHPDWATKYRKPATELRLIKGHYYLYSISNYWDPVLKKTKKITGKLLGKITEKDGFIESDKQKIRKKSLFLDYSLSIKEYGASDYIFNTNCDIIKKLKNYFPTCYNEIACMALFRLMHQSPIKSLQHFFEHSFLSQKFSDINLNANKISAMLRFLGKNRSNVVEYMRSFGHSGEHLLMDMTNIISKSSTIEYAAKGYNNKKQYDPQVNLMLLYSSTINEPVYYRMIPGNVREVKSFKLSLKESGADDIILIADKGFYSQQNIKELDNESLNYILPLRRNSSLVDYTQMKKSNIGQLQNYLKFEDRYVWYYSATKDNKNIICFLDEKLKVEEEADYLDRISSMPESFNLERFKEKYHTMGTLSIITNLIDLKPDEIYYAYKTRQRIEQMIDVMKNIIESDKTYMQDSDALEGWFFVNYIALIFYFRLYKHLVNYKALSKVSPKDVLLMLSEIKKVKINDSWVISEINSKNFTTLKKLDINIT